MRPDVSTACTTSIKIKAMGAYFSFFSFFNFKIGCIATLLSELSATEEEHLMAMTAVGVDVEAIVGGMRGMMQKETSEREPDRDALTPAGLMER